MKPTSNPKKSSMNMVEMPAKIFGSLRNYLLREQKNLQERKKRLKKEDPFSDPSRGSDNAVDSDVDEQVGHERVSAIQFEVEKMQIRVRKALTRMRVGKYGICLKCGKLIETGRLAINPTAEYCVKCEKRREDREE